MPRKAKAAGYTNRTDLAAQPKPPTQPVRVATGQQYGKARQQLQSQAQAPLPQAVEANPLDGVIAAAQQMRSPEETGLAGSLAAPSNRPREPLTAGLDIGPGPGREVLGSRGGRRRTSDTLTALADATNDPGVRALAERARSQGR